LAIEHVIILFIIFPFINSIYSFIINKIYGKPVEDQKTFMETTLDVYTKFIENNFGYDAAEYTKETSSFYVGSIFLLPLFLIYYFLKIGFNSTYNAAKSHFYKTNSESSESINKLIKTNSESSESINKLIKMNTAMSSQLDRQAKIRKKAQNSLLEKKLLTYSQSLYNNREKLSYKRFLKFKIPPLKNKNYYLL
jgi:hypothetical protein